MKTIKRIYYKFKLWNMGYCTVHATRKEVRGYGMSAVRWCELCQLQQAVKLAAQRAEQGGEVERIRLLRESL